MSLSLMISKKLNKSLGKSDKKDQFFHKKIWACFCPTSLTSSLNILSEEYRVHIAENQQKRIVYIDDLLGKVEKYETLLSSPLDEIVKNHLSREEGLKC